MERIHIYQVAWDKLLSLDCKEVSWMVNAGTFISIQALIVLYKSMILYLTV